MERVVMSTTKIKAWWMDANKASNKDGEISLDFSGKNIALKFGDNTIEEFVRDDVSLCILLAMLRQKGIQVPDDEYFLVPVFEAEELAADINTSTIVNEDKDDSKKDNTEEESYKPKQQSQIMKEQPTGFCFPKIVKVASACVAVTLAAYAGYKFWKGDGDNDIVIAVLAKSFKL